MPDCAEMRELRARREAEIALKRALKGKPPEARHTSNANELGEQMWQHWVRCLGCREPDACQRGPVEEER